MNYFDEEPTTEVTEPVVEATPDPETIATNTTDAVEATPVEEVATEEVQPEGGVENVS